MKANAKMGYENEEEMHCNYDNGNADINNEESTN